MEQAELLSTAHDEAVNVLAQCVTSYGFRASGLAAGYPQIWARDSVISSLGALTTHDSSFCKAARASIETLAEHQSPRGLIPLNVNPDTGYISTENAGSLDSNLLYILCHYLYYLVEQDVDFLQSYWESITRALHWLEYQDMNECGLLEVPEAGNWMDLISVRYNTLYDNVLYYAAVLAYEQMRKLVSAETPCHDVTIDADGIHERINLLMWIDRCWVAEHFAEHLDRLKAIRLEWFMLYHNIGTISSRPFYLPWVAFREYGDWCDTLGNSLAILTGIADGHHREHILRYMYQVDIASPYPSKAIHPPIYPGESDWREYFRSRNLNIPHQYHNGGVWLMIGGFHIAALVRHQWYDQAHTLLLKMAGGAQQGADGPWGFNEWMHGESSHPMGFDKQAWSAAMYLYAEHAVQTQQLLLFDALLAAKPAAAVAREDNTFHIHAGGGPI